MNWNVFSVAGFEAPVHLPVAIDHKGHHRDVVWSDFGIPRCVGRYFANVPRLWEPTMFSGICQEVVFVPRVLHSPELKGRALPDVRR